MAENNMDKAKEFQQAVINSARDSGAPVPAEYHDDLLLVSSTYLQVNEIADEEGRAEALATIESIIADWSWDGVKAAEESFWRVALADAIEVAKPVAKSLLKELTKKALDMAATAAMDKLGGL